MSAGNTEASQAEFEDWFALEFAVLPGRTKDGYAALDAQSAWLAWQASRQAALHEAIARVEQCMGPRSSAATALKELLK